MSDERVQALLHRQPFRPFVIRTSDGSAHIVDDPDYLARSRNGTFVTYTSQDNRAIIIDLASIESLETFENV